ncbi:hypothetical protein FNV43_RR24267 [Rhamnella rubrinervis]|uniref:QWRF motif-containing protein 7 n=1 Tax=Rhamnella rubrinervis TaxID=2594499 RepID=A0A8K0GT01_9ROSA|nr:hypothetical protein FNV43_RR24267 [Rhamnella rubrinervis]
MENSITRRGHQQASATPPPPSPRLLRSRSSGTPAMTLPAANTSTTTSLINSTQRFITNRSKSTTKTRPNKDEDRGVLLNSLPLQTISNVQKKSGKENYGQGFAYKFLHRGSSSPRGAVGTTKSGRLVPAASSPSAWALSPGRSMAAPEPPGVGRAKVKSSGGVGGVLKYFRQKKVSPIQEEDYHQFRVLHNKLMQWRFANAKAEAAMDATKAIAEEKFFSVWLTIYILRNSITEKRLQMQKLIHEIKLLQILKPQVVLLNQWTKLEKRNQESVGKLVNKLCGISIRLPLVNGAKADGMSLCEAMTMAMDVMEGIEAIISKYHSQVENVLYMVTELVIAKKQDKECWEELRNTMIPVATLLVSETLQRLNVFTH